MAKTYIGIDVGKKGAICGVSEGKLVFKEIMPLISDEDVDVVRLRQIVTSVRNADGVHVVMEKFGGWFGYNKSAVASVARQAGFIEATLILCGIAHTRISPQSWQKIMFEGTKVLRNKDGQRETKKMAFLSANRLFPGEQFLPTARYSKPHDGLVDAALLGLFGERKGY